MSLNSGRWSRQVRVGTDWRLAGFFIFFLLFGLSIAFKLFFIQILYHEKYQNLSAGQYNSYREFDPIRGEIFILKDRAGGLLPIAENKIFFTIWAVPSEITNPRGAASQVATVLALDELVLADRFLKKDDPYEPIASKVTEDLAVKVKLLALPGIYFKEEMYRYYPEGGLTSHLTGFLGYNNDKLVGNYGLESYFDDMLSGQKGFLQYAKAPGGKLINVLKSSERAVANGSSLVLTIDSVLQYKVCDLLAKMSVATLAEGGTVVLLDAKNSKVRAMCSYPYFNANDYATVDNIYVYNNPAVFEAYEPGSVMKSITMAAGLNEKVIKPSDTYIDEGVAVYDKRSIKNADGKAHGEVSMTQVLVESLNLGAIHVAEKIGKENFKKYIDKFGFGSLTGIELSGERAGDLSPLEKEGAVYTATASYGQGITATPIQLVTAYGALANGGKLISPRIVEKIITASGEELPTETPAAIEVLSLRASTLVSSMLVSVVADGHAKAAGVPGYVLAAKTGTAQVGGQYTADNYNHTVVGYGPIDNPVFVLLVKLKNPQSYPYAEGTAAPLFGQIAKFVLQYYHIPPSKEL